MPIPGLLAGLEEGLATEVAKQRQDQRAREDREFTQNLQLLDQLRQDPRTTPEMYQRVMQATLQQQKGLGSQRKPKKGMAGFMGQTDTAPYHSDILDQLASGQIPLFQDKAAFDAARTGTSDDLRQHLASGVAGQGAGAAQPGSPGVPPPPTPQPPSAGPIPPLGDQTSYVGAFHPRPDAPISGQTNTATPPAGPPNAAAAAAGAPPPAGGGQVPAPPPGPIPSLAGTGHMTQAAAGLADNVQAGGPIIPAPPSATDIYASHRTNPSAFFNPDEMAQIQASASTQAIPYQAKGDYDALIAAGMDPKLATLAVARKLTGFTGGVTSGEGTWYQGPDGKVFKSILQRDNYGGFQHVNPTTGIPLGPEYKQVDPASNQIIIDASGQARVVSKVGGPTSAPLTDPTGQTKLGKPYTPPPAFQSVQVVTGPKGEPQLVGVPRGGGPTVPLTVGAGAVPPPPKPGQPPSAAPTPATKFVMPKTLSDSQSKALVGVQNVEQSSQRALDIIDQMEKQGESMNSPIGQSIDLWLVRHGWDPGELQEELFQNVGYQEINAMNIAGMGGRPNTRMIDIFQNHVGQPGSSLSLLRTQLKGLIRLSEQAKGNILQTAGTYRPQPWEAGASGPGAAGGAGTTATPPPPPRWSNTPAGK